MCTHPHPRSQPSNLPVDEENSNFGVASIPDAFGVSLPWQRHDAALLVVVEDFAKPNHS